MNGTAVLSALSVVALVATGCGGSDRTAAVRVTGRVTLDGKPLGAGKVYFIPVNGRTATGDIREDGIFALGTNEPGDGAAPGQYRVKITAREELGDDPLSPGRKRLGRSLIPEIYGDPIKSGLKFDVDANGKNDIRIDLHKNPRKAARS